MPSGTPHASTPPPARGRVLTSRYRRITRFAGRFLLQAWWFEIVLPRLGLGAFAARGRTARLIYMARRFRVLAGELGGLMIKVGQFLSSRLDVLPPEITRELEGLQDEVTAETFEDIKRQVEADLGLPLGVAFASFEPEAIAAASLGQAHRAQLSPGLAGDWGFADVVVKVQRPGIQDVVEVDLAALRRIARWVARIRLVNTRVNAPALVEEFAETSLEEIDYLHEAANAERFATDFADDPKVVAPVVIWERTSLRVLTLGDVTAIKITDLEALDAAGIDRKAVAQELARATFQQIFVHGFFHADPHPGNLFVTPRPAATGEAGTGETNTGETGTGESGTGGADWTLTYVDFGMMGQISDSLRSGLRDFILAAVGRDAHGLVTALEGLGVLLSTGDTEDLERALGALFDRFGGMGIAELQRVDQREFERFGREFGETVRALPFQLPENFLLLIRTISLISGVTSALDRDFNMWEAVDPFARTILSSGTQSAVRDLPWRALSYATQLAGIPGRMDEVVTRLNRGQIAVKTPDVDRRLRSLEKIIGRLVSAIVFAALLFAGVLARPDNEVLSWVLIGVSVIPFLHALFSGRGR